MVLQGHSAWPWGALWPWHPAGGGELLRAVAGLSLGQSDDEQRPALPSCP